MPLVLDGAAGDRRDLVSRWFRRVAKHFANEMAVVTPDGDLLSHSPEEGLRKWRALPVEERRKLADLGEVDRSLDPLPPAGGLVLEVFARALSRSEDGKLAAYRTEVARSFEPGRDHFWITADEARSFLPAKLEKGAAAEVPGSLVERIARHALIDLVRVGGNGGPRKREEVLARSLRAVIGDSTDGVLEIRLEGSARLATHDAGSGARKGSPKIDDYRLEGRLVYETSKAAFRRFDLLAFSPTGHFDEIHDRVLPLGVAFELTRAETPAERVPPSSYTRDYFGGRAP